MKGAAGVGGMGGGIDALENPRFWFAYFAAHFGAIGDPFDEDVLKHALGVEPSESTEWWEDFTGWYDGVMEEADGAVDDPGMVRLELVPGLDLVCEFHPGDTYLSLVERGTEPLMLGNIGPHWALPALRLDEIRDWYSGNVSRAGSLACLFMVPWAWSTADQPEDFFDETLNAALAESELFDAKLIRSLVFCWKAAVSGGREYEWLAEENGYVTTAEWSTCGCQTPNGGKPWTCGLADRQLARTGLATRRCGLSGAGGSESRVAVRRDRVTRRLSMAPRA